MRDHPRPCGEKAAAIDDICLRLGSPPPMRGKAVGMADRAAALGITPAHAGKRYVRIKRESPSQDHPRPCGEKKNSSTKISINLGSPPPMRGKGGHNARDYGDRRITPAHAGKSFCEAV